jgi:midasin
MALRTQIPPSYCAKLVEVMRELQRRRQGSAVFAGKDGFITARDLLRCVLFAQRSGSPSVSCSSDEPTR